MKKTPETGTDGTSCGGKNLKSKRAARRGQAMLDVQAVLVVSGLKLSEKSKFRTLRQTRKFSS